MITLTDPDLGTLSLRADPYVVVSFEVGSPAPRVVMRNRALANGMRDDTRFSGARAVTVAVRLNEKPCANPVTIQDLFDRLLPYMNVRRRPILAWTLPGGSSVRQLTVRGENAPMVIAGAHHPTIACQFVSADGEITTPDGPGDNGEWCVLVNPATDVESGRTYDLAFDRSYPPSAAVGDRIINHAGSADAHWTASLFGITTNPFVKVNGVTVNFNNNGGLAVPAGSSVVIDTKEQTIRLNGDPLSPRFDKTNFTAWSWADLMLHPGDNLIRFGASVLGAGASMNFCWHTTQAA